MSYHSLAWYYGQPEYSEPWMVIVLDFATTPEWEKPSFVAALLSDIPPCLTLAEACSFIANLTADDEEEDSLI